MNDPNADDGPVSGIPPDLVVGEAADFLPLAGEVNWGMSKFDIEKLRAVSNGRGVVTGVVDTGVDRSHPDLTNVIAAKDFTGSPYGAADRNEHGTHTTGTVGASDPRIGVAIGCKLVHGKALSDAGSGSGTWIAAAIRWCVDQGAEIVSMSLGSSSEDPRITAAIKEVAGKGVWVVCAGGNSGAGTPDVDWPGRSEHCLSVAALKSNMTPASFSNSGEKIDTSGPGQDIWSTRPGGGYRQMSGTSMATPFVAGVLTLLRAAWKEQGLPVPDVYSLRKILSYRSVDIGTPGKDTRTGPGWVSPLLLTLALTPEPPPVRPAG